MRILRILSIAFLALAPQAFAEQRSFFTGLDKPWLEGLASGIEPVSARLAHMLAGSEGVAKDDICGCAINDRGQIFDPGHCPVVFETRDEKMAVAVAIPLVTPSDWAFNLACFKEGAPGCRSSEGVSYIGETCCRMVDTLFAHGKGDLNFYLLAPAPVAKRIATYRYGESSEARPVHEGCALLVDDRRMLWSLPQAQTGFVARTWLYAVAHFGANAPYALGVLRKMSVAYPTTAAEYERASRIATFQGRGNREILGQ